MTFLVNTRVHLHVICKLISTDAVFQTSRLSFGDHDHYSLNLLPVQKLMFRSWTCTSSPLCFSWCSREHKLKTRTYNGLRINYSKKYLPDVFTRTISVL